MSSKVLETNNTTYRILQNALMNCVCIDVNGVIQILFPIYKHTQAYGMFYYLAHPGKGNYGYVFFVNN